MPSPTISDSSSRKRRFDDLDDHHASSAESDRPLDDATPRPGRFLQSQQILQTQPLGWIPYSVERGRGTPSVTSRASSHSVATSSRSGRSKQDSASNRSSPSKQLRNAEMNDTGFTVGSFVLEPQPESLRKLRIELRDFGAGYGVCPASMKDEMLAKDPELPRYAFDNTEAPCPSASTMPPFDWVEDLVRRANKCRIDRECEASWNGDVHAPILEQVFRAGRFSSIDMVDFRWCPTAQILQSFRPQKAPTKMVDFCVFVCPGEGTSEESAIKNLCQNRPGQSINHTDLGNFCKHPIVLSIETKRPGEHGDNATLQIGTWHSAQWRSLRYEQNRSSRSIEFLPGIIIQGHEWRFVASVLDVSGKCQLLEAVALGNTGSTLGVYSLMASLQRLRRWIKEEYWQAFVSDILI
ncbi:hypothetical protein BGZ61DRAFT_362441 [Ilyonectria robusta]|uniref:uncharacterized protein n=1 Tax=Ilyonectria robusta TaxID=1079257 RepID=UPI001E8D5C08|nr:uncharacterized protein BGZ61DRAFT_362441 [Ilyonectria robusta]KAH8672252.1 hypothetical protein BGZ61DRAFT_362441 [Ilyonectria robusta]